MHLTGILFIAALLQLGLCVAKSGDAERPAILRNLPGALLPGYDAIYAALTNGSRVRYFMDLPNCILTAGKPHNGQGGEIDYFEAIHVASFLDIMEFSFQKLEILEAKTVNLWYDFELYSQGEVYLSLYTLDPKTGKQLASSQFTCSVSDGRTGNAYFVNLAPSPPRLLMTYSDIHAALRAGNVATYTAVYQGCSPSPTVASTAGGAITVYEDAGDSGILYSGSTQTESAGTLLYNKVDFSIYPNGTVNVQQNYLTANYTFIDTTSYLCLINNGKNNGPFSFFAQSTKSAGFPRLPVL